MRSSGAYASTPTSEAWLGRAKSPSSNLGRVITNDSDVWISINEGLTRRAELGVEKEREKTARAEKARQTAELKAAAEKSRTERTRLQANASTMLSVEPKAASGRKV